MTTKPKSSFFRRDDSKAAPVSSNPAPSEHSNRAPRSFDKPERKFDRGDRPARSFDRNNDRPARSFDKNSDRPARSFDRNNDRPARPFDKSDRPARSFDRNNDRPARSFDKNSDRPARSFDRNNDRPARPFDKSDRPARSFDRNNDRPTRSFDKNSDRPARSFDRNNDRPARSFDRNNDRPARPFDKNSDRPARSFDRDSRGEKTFEKSDRPFKKFAPREDRPVLTERVEREARPAKRNESYAPRTEKAKKSSYAPPKSAELPTVLRLNRFIAQSGICSRREADALIQNGEITVNDVVVTELGTKIDTTVDVVKFEGKPLTGEKLVYLIMNKPKGFVTTTEDPHAEQTVIDLLKGQVRERIYPVGRLDKNTTGVLLLTNDGDLTRELTHPSFEKRKIYHVFLDKPVSEEDLEKLARGVELEDGMMTVDQISYVDGNRKEVGVEIHSGRNRIVRRLFEHLDYRVVKLDRVYFAGFTKEGLRRGFWRVLTAREVAQLKSGQYK